MDVFALRDAVINDYERFATSFTKIHAADIRGQVDAIYANRRYWPEPLIQINPNYLQTTDVEKAVADGTLEPECADLFRTDPTPEAPRGLPFSLYKHQEQAITLGATGESYVVTTGTGSGKSLCFFLPIINAVLKEKRSAPKPRTRAIIIYPMNALANSQLEELDKFVKNAPDPKPITFARYTGQESQEHRQRVADNPPDILLTNFMMLELLMTRQEELDQKVMANCADLRFLVLDELHTYRGRQGADVALLVRRVRERLAPSQLQCVGTSATMASEGTLKDKNELVAGVASKLFSVPIPHSNVVGETLERATAAREDQPDFKKTLAAALAAPIDQHLTDAQLREHPLAIWVETQLGITFSQVDQRWVRAKPRSLTQAVELLSEHSGSSQDSCRSALREFLLLSSTPEIDRTGLPSGRRKAFFAFKLHQFISGAGHAYSTLEPAGIRTVTVDGQQYLPGTEEKRLYALHFCRECGQEYHPVRRVSEPGSKKLLARDIDDAPPPAPDDLNEVPVADAPADDAEEWGFLTLHPKDVDFSFTGQLTDYPETWLQTNASGVVQLKASYRGSKVEQVRVEPTGECGTGHRAWFIPGKFRFCLRCGQTHTTSARDRNRLASLSAEGRSSATTVLVGSALRWMHGEDSGLEPAKRKLLGFTDNRQDAALQAGHFNDFLFVSLIRAGFLGALEAAGSVGITGPELGAAQQKALGFEWSMKEARAEWLLDPDIRGLNVQNAETTLRDVLSYRVWFDQRRGWRYTNPNLEQLELVSIDYRGLSDLAADDELYSDAPAILRRALPSVRAQALRVVLDYLRQSMAIRSRVLLPSEQDQLRSRSLNYLQSPWGLGSDERPQPARWLFLQAPRFKDRRNEDLVVRGGPRSALGRQLWSSDTWAGDASIRALKSIEIEDLTRALLEAAGRHGLVLEEATTFGDDKGWRLVEDCVVFHRAAPKPGEPEHRNAYFTDFYTNLARMLREPGHPLFGFEAREHTAQVDAERRQIREKRFRFGEKEESELAEEQKKLHDIGESPRFLPVLFCSPTMELGVDISALNAVYLRNVPPTPANYAQRSGRAGRSGQAALVLTYCSAQGPHDQYFFRDPEKMVHGEVRAPLLDLANRDLIDSHLQAIWLAATKKPLDAEISNLLVLGDAGRPLREDLLLSLSQPEIAAEARSRIHRVLDLLGGELTGELAPWYSGRDAYAEETVSQALRRFDKAFDRWRSLFSSAERQRDAARKVIDDYSVTRREKDAAEKRHAQAIQQITLLRQADNERSSDFYTYRYLATEGFLPGYNFPRLPLMAFIPASNDRRGKQAFLQRPRFLALAEFGPRSLVYHEGRAFRVVRAMLDVGPQPGGSIAGSLTTRKARLCRKCGAGHFEDERSMCHVCARPLDDAELVTKMYRIENVGTWPAERITANDEERQRQGFELQTTFEWAVREGEYDARAGRVDADDGEVATISYGAAASITRFNKGLRRRAHQSQLGFKIDPISGYWEKNDDEESDPDVGGVPKEWIVPYVQDRKNALLFSPSAEEELAPETITTLQHALLRGIEATFELEQGEVMAEPMPTRDDRKSFLLYEAAEGGAGVLNRLVSEPTTLAQVAREALAIMHFTLASDGSLPATGSELEDQPETNCVAACYRCLMSYYNQIDHELLDRRDPQVRELLLRLVRAQTSLFPKRHSRHPSVRASAPPPHADDAYVELLQLLKARELPTPDVEPLVEAGHRLPLAWRSHYVVASFDDLPSEVLAALEDKGIQILVLGRDRTAWPTRLPELARLLGALEGGQ